MSALMEQQCSFMPSHGSLPQTGYWPGLPSERYCSKAAQQPSFNRVMSDASVAFRHVPQYIAPSVSRRNTISSNPEVQLSLTQDEIRRLLDAAEYVERERAFLIKSLEGLTMLDKPSRPPALPRSVSTSSSGQPPMLMRDEGGLFRFVSSPRVPSPCGSPPRCLGVPQQSHIGPGAMEDNGEEDMDSDNFRMFRFKVQLCREPRCHDWAECPFAHPGEKAGRRDPRMYRYSASPCPDVKRSGKCSRGDACTMAHGVFECWLHPSRYRTQPCKDGAKCPRKVCFFAHSPDELRLAPAAAAAAAADVVSAVQVPLGCGFHGMPLHPLELSPHHQHHVQSMEQQQQQQLQHQPQNFPHLVPIGSSPQLHPTPTCILSPALSSPPSSPPRSGSSSPFTNQDVPNWTGPYPEQFLAAGINTAAYKQYPVVHQRETAATAHLDKSIPSMCGSMQVIQQEPSMNFGSPEQHVPHGCHGLARPAFAWTAPPAASRSCLAEEEPDVSWVASLLQ